MGFFSGSFGSGLLSGLATSIDATLKSAIDQRNKDMSRARTFWETRQAQKIQRAEEHDTRAEKAIVRLANEFDGDFAKGLAAYKALGGDIDKVQAYIDDVDETRKINSSYSLKDKIAFDKIDLSQFGDVDKERAMKAIRMEVKPVSTSYRDTSGLARLGLGMDDASEKMNEKINSMFQSRLREDIEGLKGAIVNREGLASSIAARQKLEKNVPSVEKRLQNAFVKLETGVNPLTGENLTEAEKYEVEQSVARNIKYLKQLKDITKTSTGTDRQVLNIMSRFQKGNKDLENLYSYKREQNSIFLTDPKTGNPVPVDQAGNVWREETGKFAERFIRKELVDEETLEPNGAAAEAVFTSLPSLRSKLNEMRAAKANASGSGTGTQTGGAGTGKPTGGASTVKPPQKKINLADNDKTKHQTLARTQPKAYAKELANRLGTKLTDAQIENIMEKLDLTPNQIKQIILNYRMEGGMTTGMFR